MAASEPAYMSGFGNEFATEALPGALPTGQNNPQVCPYGLYAEQLSGTAFTAPRKDNLRTWLYRIRPSVVHAPFTEIGQNSRFGTGGKDATVTPNQLRWCPFELPSAPTDFIAGLQTVCSAGSPETKDGYAIHIYAASSSMEDSCLCNADGDFLIVPQEGSLRVQTEMGILHVAPGEICVVQRGVRFAAGILGGSAARGYVLEIYSSHFVLPELGPIGANGLANARDFLSPVAHFEDKRGEFRVVHKFGGRLFEARQRASPFDVVAWHGNYAPFKYDLARFCPINAVSFDHSDPSIFTVLTCPSTVPGTAVADFVIFPPRWAVAEHTFRPPYYHRNTMSEFMGCIRGVYDGKAAGFSPGGASLHSCMSPHGPDVGTFEAASTADLKPAKLPEDSLSFMFEVNCIPKVHCWALESELLQKDYYQCWQGLDSSFTGQK